MSQIEIGRNPVGVGAPCFVIAEIGINHNGSIEDALALIEAAVNAGANAVKFQVRDVPVVYGAEERAKARDFDPIFAINALRRMTVEDVTYPVFPEPGQLERIKAFVEGKKVETTNGDLKYALEFGPKDWDQIRAACQKFGIAWGVSAWDGLSVHQIDGFQPDFHKIASACLTHEDLLQRVKSTGKPVILSTGGSTLEQIKKAVSILGRDNLAILQCTATYPSADEEVNLSVMSALGKEFPNVPIGYSGHEADTLASRLAASMGATIVERHITLDRSLPGSDQGASIEPDELQELVTSIRWIETQRGTTQLLETANWLADGDDESRISVIKGDSSKQVLEREVGTMEKLRRVTDF